MSITHRKYSGFFPFPIYKTSSLLVTSSTPSNVTMPLASLSKAYWLAKTFDYNINVTASLAGISTTLVGSGTLTINSFVQQNGTPILGVTMIPGIRTAVNQTLPSDNPNQSGPSNLMLYTSTTAVFSSIEAGYFGWFAPFAQDSFGNNIPMVIDSGAYKTFADAELTTTGGYTLQTTGGNATGLSCKITVDGVSVSIPVYCLTASPTASGTFEIDFNNFWTP